MLQWFILGLHHKLVWFFRLIIKHVVVLILTCLSLTPSCEPPFSRRLTVQEWRRAPQVLFLSFSYSYTQHTNNTFTVFNIMYEKPVTQAMNSGIFWTILYLQCPCPYTLLSKFLTDFAVCGWWRYCKALWDEIFSQREENDQKFCHIHTYIHTCNSVISLVLLTVCSTLLFQPTNLSTHCFHIIV